MVDLEGLQVAFLGVALAHFLDLETGDIIDLLPDEEPPGDPSRYRRIPTRTPESEAEDRRLYIESLPPSVTRDQLVNAVDDPMSFRRTLMEDRLIEKKWFHFKNDQATRAIAQWLEQEGLE